MTSKSSVSLNGMDLRPAPFVSTSYEYNKSGEYVIGGFLLVTLSGELIGKDIIAQISSLNSLHSNMDCVELIIGCQGGTDFLQGAGRIRSVDVKPGDQPYIAGYTIVVAIESINGKQSVEPDPQFLTSTCLSKQDAQYILSYTEELNITGDGTAITSVDNVFGVSKSFIKGKGQISVTCYGKYICGNPNFSSMDQAISIVKSRASSLENFSICSPDNPLSAYAGWSKWLDTKSLTIDDTGAITWNFDLYMSKGSCKPTAWVEIATDDKQDQRQETKNRTINGTISGLSSATIEDWLGNRADTNERISNAESAYSAIEAMIKNGEWPGESITLKGTDGSDCSIVTTACQQQQQKPKTCYQRISSNVTKSVVAGQISFSAEFADINICKPRGAALVDVTIDETFPVSRYVEVIVPNNKKSIVQVISDTPHKVTVTVRGTLQGCDQKKMQEVLTCVDNQFNLSINRFNGWLVTDDRFTIGTYTYIKVRSFVRCG